MGQSTWGHQTSTNMSMIDMDDLVSKISVDMAPWEELKMHTACVCCDCSFWTEYPQCCGCREVGTCCCCSGAGMCNIDWSNVAEGFCCQAISVAYCINMKTCKADCMGSIWGQEAGQAICCKTGQQNLCVDQRYAIPCDEDVPLQCSCCGFYVKEAENQPTKFSEYKGAGAKCNDGDGTSQ